jgi:hypothetical protein
MNLVILGDSLPLPRPNEGVLFEHTYPSILQRMLNGNAYVINRSKRANNSRKAALPNNLSADITDFNPEVLIYHIGIVDCAPRLFSEFQQKILEKMPSFISRRIIKFFSSKRYFFTRTFPKVYVKRKAFYKNVKQTISFAKQYTDKIILVGICHANSNVLKKSFSFADNVNKYNDELIKISNELGVDYLDTRLLNPEHDLLSDGIHYNLSANEKLAMAILEKIKSLGFNSK